MSSKMPEEGKGKGLNQSLQYLMLLRTARDLRVLFRNMAAQLDLHHGKANIARVFGASLASAGGGVAIGGGIAMLFTMGISSILAIVGSTVAATGAATASGAGICKYLIERKILNKAATKWATFCRLYKKVYKLRVNQASNPGEPSGVVAGLAGAGVAGVGFAAREAVATGAGVGGNMAKTATQLAAAAASATMVLNVVLLGYSIYQIIDGSLEIHRQRQSPAGDVLRGLADELERMTEGVDETFLDDDMLDAMFLIDDIRLPSE